MRWLAIVLSTLSIVSLSTMTVQSENGENRIQWQVQKKLSAGEKPNRLIKEKSPYLLQHAFNPVDWYPWGEEAIARARKEDKPIFLSVGYSTCHWCHVMAEESFEDQAIADILNKWFISIKVDREERPDIDQMYMAATQLMSGSGGWPMSVFMMHDGSPFYTGTYFPVESMGSRPGFKIILLAIQKAWAERRDDLTAAAAQLIQTLELGNLPAKSVIEKGVIERAYSDLVKRYDKLEGGFSTAPKFPRPAVLSFLLSYYLHRGEEKSKEMVMHTIEKMAAGGMYDQLGGGFHRYSVDQKWKVPHFEKMLYDQAQLVNSYLAAFQITRDKQYAIIAEEILAYTLREMHDPGGGFYSAEDADSDDPYNPAKHSEGAYYLWTKDDVDQRLGKHSTLFSSVYGIRKEGNVEKDPFAEFSGKNILFKTLNIVEAAAKFKITEEQAKQSLAFSRDILFKARETRKKPHLDDKIITAWNGMMIGAFARGSRILDNSELLVEAVKTANFLQQHLYNRKTKSLQRRYRNGESGLDGQLDDYTYLADGLLELYQATHDPRWLIWSHDLTQQQISLFWNATAGYFYDSVADPSIKVRMRERYDGATPTGNSVAVHNLLRLGMLYKKPEWSKMAQRLLQSFAEIINGIPTALPTMLTALQQIDEKPVQVVIAGVKGAGDTKKLLDVVNSSYDPGRLLLLADGAENQKYLAEKLSFMDTVSTINNKATAYVCYDFTCKLPVNEAAALQQQLALQNTTRP